MTAGLAGARTHMVAAMLAAGLLMHPPPCTASSHLERAIGIGGLAATHLVPEGGGGMPVAVIVAGSGPTDRDGNSVNGLSTDAYRLLAHALSDLGIASVRYDKRGIGGSADLARDENALTFDVFARDVTAVAAWARTNARPTAVVLVGHSEGGVLVLAAARQARAQGVVLLTTPGRTLGAVLRDQLGRPGLPPDLRGEALAIIAALERGESVTHMRPELEPLFRPSVQPFLRSWIGTDPAAILRGLALPALVIGGGRDIQVGRADFDALVAARPGIEHVWLGEMSHVLKTVPEGLQGQGQAYLDPKLPLAEGLAERIGAFIHAAAPRGPASGR